MSACAHRGVVEIDETLMGKIEGAPKRMRTGGSKDRNIVVTLVERGGSARSYCCALVALLKGVVHPYAKQEHASQISDILLSVGPAILRAS